MAEIYDAQDCKWVMHDTAILVQDSALEAQFIVYSAMTGAKIVCHQPNVNMGLGIRTLSHSPNQKLLACAIYDANLVIYNMSTLVQICELHHKSSIVRESPADSRANQPDVFKEELLRHEGRAQFVGGDSSALGYHYVNVAAQACQADSKTTIKIP